MQLYNQYRLDPNDPNYTFGDDDAVQRPWKKVRHWLHAGRPRTCHMRADMGLQLPRALSTELKLTRAPYLTLMGRLPVQQVALAIGLLLVGTILLAVGLGLYLSGAPDSHGAGAGCPGGGRGGRSAASPATLLRHCGGNATATQRQVAPPGRWDPVPRPCLPGAHAQPAAPPSPDPPHPPPLGIPLMVLGSLTFLPGFYHTRIAYKAWKGHAGFSLQQIPDF